MKIALILSALIYQSVSTPLTEVSNNTTNVPEVQNTQQVAPSFSFLRGHKQGKNTTVTWGMSNNTGIDHFIVECTYEDPGDIYSVWQTAGNIACTSNNTPIFKFVDTPVLPGVLNYRITAVMTDNSTVESPIYSVVIQ